MGKIANAVHTVSDGEAALDFVHQRGDYGMSRSRISSCSSPSSPARAGWRSSRN